MSDAVDPKAVLPSGKIIIEEAPFDGAHHGRVDGDWRPVAEEAPADNKQYARQNGGWSEVTAEGVDYGTGLTKDVSATPPIVNLQPATDFSIGGIMEPPQTPPDSKQYVRVYDPTLPEGWKWSEATAQGVDYGIGLALNDGADPAVDPKIVDLTPAGDAPQFLGGVYVVDRVRNVEEGLELGIDGRLRAPLATDSLAGTLLEPPPDDRGYVRARSAAGVSAWVPPAETLIDFGTGLTKDETATPPIVHLQPATDFSIGGLKEPPQDGFAYSRQFDATLPEGWKWAPALTAGLQITSIIPDKAIYGPGEQLLTVHAYGTAFTPTTVAVVDGVDTTTTVLSTTELTFVLNPAVPINEQFHIITVRDPAAAPPDGLGAEQFDFIKASTEVDYGTGLTLDTTPTPPIVHLQPAGPTDKLLGGVWVPPRDATQGLAIDMGDEALGDPATGELRAPLATPELAGSIVEPPADAKGYVRTTQLDGISQWVPPALTPTEYGVGLTYDETADPPIVHLQPAGFQQKFLGGIWAPARSLTQALDLNPATGLLQAPQATHEHLGAILEPRETGKTFGRQRDPTTGIADWVEVAGGGGIGDVPLDPVQPWSRTPGRWVAAIPEVPPDDVLHARRGGDPATWEPFLPFEDVPVDPTGQQYSRQHGNWHPIPPPHIENPAGKTEPEIGVVFVPDRSGLSVGPDGALWLEPATADEIGGLREVPGDGEWVRKRGAWEPLPPGSTVEAGIGLEKTGDVIDLQPPVASDPTNNIAPEIGGVYGTPRSDRNGIEIDGYGHISAPLATPELAGTIIEPVADAKGYVRTTQLDGTSQWVPPASTEMATHTELGTVRVPARNNHNQGLNLDSQGFLFAPPATPDHLGTILEPRDPRALHARVRDGTTGNAEWEMFEPGIGDVSDTVNVYGRTNSRWIQLQPGGTFPPASLLYVQVNGDTMQGPLYLAHEGALAMEAVTVSQLERWRVEAGIGLAQIGPRIDLQPATNIQIGGILDAPDDGQQYARKFREWERVAPSATPVTYGIGIDETAGVVNLKQANFNGEIGGVMVVGRGPTQGLEYDAATGTLWAPLATDIAAGAIVEPPPDGSQYCRTRDMGGLSTWVRSAAGGVIVADDPPDEAMTPAGTLWWESDTGELYILYDDGTSKQWVEAVATPNAGVQTHIGDLPPAIANVGDLWWDSDAGTLAIYYQDVDSTQWVQIAGPMPEPPAGGIAEAPIDGTPYSRQDAGWVASAAALAMFTPGDLKHGFQVADHAGWIKLDGRAVSTLTATQQAAAATLGFTTNLPLGDGAVFMQSAAVLGSVSGGTLTQAMLPNVTLTSSNSAALTSGNSAALNTGDAGAHDVVSPYSSHEMTINTASSIFSIDEGVMVTIPAHNHTIPAHNHSIPAHNHPVPLGGTGADIVPKNISATAFVFLGV